MEGRIELKPREGSALTVRITRLHCGSTCIIVSETIVPCWYVTNEKRPFRFLPSLSSTLGQDSEAAEEGRSCSLSEYARADLCLPAGQPRFSSRKGATKRHG